jgi:hypothetical protein
MPEAEDMVLTGPMGGFTNNGHEGCTVLGGPFALVMQGVLFSITVGVLVFKKYREDLASAKQGAERRSWYEFGLDGSKQFMGAGWIHVANLLCAILFQERLKGVDECTWYAANIIVDDTLGVFVEYLLLMGVKKVLEMSTWESVKKLLDSGSYYEERDGKKVFKPWNYVSQLVVWLLIVTAMKLSMVAFMTSLPVLEYAFNTMLSPFQSDPRRKLFVVMIVVPVLMNSLQFWVTDNFIKKAHGEEDDNAVPLAPTLA